VGPDAQVFGDAEVCGVAHLTGETEEAGE
jgi:hypothetical protein